MYNESQDQKACNNRHSSEETVPECAASCILMRCALALGYGGLFLNLSLLCLELTFILGGKLLCLCLLLLLFDLLGIRLYRRDQSAVLPFKCRLSTLLGCRVCRYLSFGLTVLIIGIGRHGCTGIRRLDRSCLGRSRLLACRSLAGLLFAFRSLAFRTLA